MILKPSWLLRKQESRVAQRELTRRHAETRALIEDVCADIDVWLDIRPGTTLAGVLERIGGSPTLYVLRTEYGRLLTLARRHGVPDSQEVSA